MGEEDASSSGTPPGEEIAATEIAAHLQQIENDVPASVRSQLSAARRTALAEARPPTLPWRTLSWSGAGAFAIMLFALVVVLPSQSVDQMPDLDAGDFMAAQEVDLLEDLEFAAWVADMDEMDSADVPRQG